MPDKAPKSAMALPTFKTEAEERNFWKTHDATDYLDLSKAQRVTFVKIRPSPRGDFERYLGQIPDARMQQGDEFT